MDSDLFVSNASTFATGAVIGILFLLVIVQHRQVNRYRRKVGLLASGRLGPQAKSGVPRSAQSWFVSQIRLPVVLLDIQTARVMTVSPGGRDWLESLGIAQPELFLERQLYSAGGENLSFRALSEELQNFRREPVSFIDQLEISDEEGDVHRRTVNVDLLPLECENGLQALAFISGVLSETDDDTAFRKFYQLIGAALTQPDLGLALSAILSALAKTTSQSVGLSIAVFAPETGKLELASRLALPASASRSLHSTPVSYGAGVQATAAALGRHLCQDVREQSGVLSEHQGRVLQDSGFHVWASWPITGLAGQLLGTLDVYAARGSLIERLSRRVPLALHLAAATLERHEATRQIQARVQSLELQALYDHLTGLYSRGKTEDAVRQAIARAQRYQVPFAVVLFDIDFFKRINDTWGHDIGDAVLKVLSERVRATVRGADVVGRWGGEEFLLMLPETRLEDACTVADNVRIKIQDGNYRPVPVVTVSLGVAGYTPGDSVESLIKKADEALYLAKQRGRNRVEAWREEAQPGVAG